MYDFKFCLQGYKCNLIKCQFIWFEWGGKSRSANQIYINQVSWLGTHEVLNLSNQSWWKKLTATIPLPWINFLINHFWIYNNIISTVPYSLLLYIYRYFQVPTLNTQTIDQLSISLCFQRRNCLRESGNGVGHSCTRRRRGHPCHTSRRATRAMWSSDATLPKDRRRCSQSPKVSPRRCRTCGT